MTSETLASAPRPEPAAGPVRRCQNCGEVLLGEHCYACGQPTRGLVRHFGSIIGDFMDSVFELDSRILRTLGPLLFKPGYLSDEYFAGRRVRYVSPVRLFVFLSLFAFIAAQWSFSIDGEDSPVTVNTGDRGPVELNSDAIGRAQTREDVEQALAQALEGLERTRKETADVPGLAIGLEAAERGVRAAAQARLAELEAAAPARADAPPAEAPPAAPAQDAPEAPGDASVPRGTGTPREEGADTPPRISFDGTPWDARTNPLRIGWLPEAANAKLNQQIGRAQDNIGEIQDDPNKLKDAFLSTVPTVLFVLLPLFALLLKIMYVFKKRLYMEHLIVALHSHSFLCASLLLVLLLDAVKGWTDALAWISRPLGWAELLLIAWMPIYLLLMQKRVYRQGWIMTLLKYCVLGTCYLFLISLGATMTLLISLVNM